MDKKTKHIVIDARNRRSSTGRYTDRHVNNLQKIDRVNNYTVLVEPDDNWKLENNNFRTVSCKFKQFSFNPIDQIVFARQLSSLKPDLVHFTMTQQPLLYKGKTITTTHDLTMLNFTRPSRFPPWLHKIGINSYKYLFRKSHEKSSAIIVPSNYVAKALAEYQPSVTNKIVVTYEAADPPLSLKPMAVKGVEKPFLLHVGTPFPHKNIERLIKAFDQLKNTHPDLLLVLPGKMKNQFEKDFKKWVGESKNKNSIISPGYVNEAELKWLYEHAECYVLPSLSEGFGLPGLEAMAHGCPVVSSNAACLPEIYGDAAHYFDPENIPQMVKATDDVLSDNQLQEKLVKIGHEQVKKYSWAKTAEQTFSAYEKLFKG